ncbi:MAG: CBS domain-containing protein [Chloroflexi bacterium]|nr:CBS domain-containing protein [Chloroflexota bacterium]
MKVSEIMTKNVMAAEPDDKVVDVAKVMLKNGISGVPVVDESNRVIGIITEADLVVRNAYVHFPTFLQILDSRIYLQSPRHFEEELRRALGTTAADVMTREVHTIDADAEVRALATLMVEEKVNPVPVTHEGKLVGIVSRADIIRFMVEQEAAS